MQGDEDRRDRVGEDQDHVLGDLGVGDALHAAEHRIDEDDPHAHDQPVTMSTSMKREKTIPTPRICPAT